MREIERGKERAMMQWLAEHKFYLDVATIAVGIAAVVCVETATRIAIREAKKRKKE